MPRIVRLAAVTIYIHADDQVVIETLQVLRGHFRRAHLAQAISWAAENQALLRAKWSEYNERD
jgi:hypothetical protein